MKQSPETAPTLQCPAFMGRLLFLDTRFITQLANTYDSLLGSTWFRNRKLTVSKARPYPQPVAVLAIGWILPRIVTLEKQYVILIILNYYPPVSPSPPSRVPRPTCAASVANVVTSISEVLLVKTS
ncbi:hypothetical protein AVEN_11008-1 [Araneus ventricosus]|uniref:Uncharacterized protein n=1 Tax=Araneus ventricosus TaxID=182803 RepID=A0A4Y2HGB8_ARAVE|nr:hypothetical protein AVEN_11008-1 [Araneus ventricosus]